MTNGGQDDEIASNEVADPLAEAFREVRERFDGEPSADEDAERTLQRALFRARTQNRRRRLLHWVVLPAAAALVASSAWAGVTGRLGATMHTLLDTVHDAPPPPKAASTAPTTAAVTTPEADAGVVAAEALTVADTMAPSSVGTASTAAPDKTAIARSVERALAPAPAETAPASVAGRRTTSPTRDERVATAPDELSAETVKGAETRPPLAPTPSASSAADPSAALFAAAHQLHFVERDAARALTAWDGYLAQAPNGRFVPEARYNRALALVRLGRMTEAKSELASFANGTYGDYRRAEAKALLSALDHP